MLPEALGAAGLVGSVKSRAVTTATVAAMPAKAKMPLRVGRRSTARRRLAGRKTWPETCGRLPPRLRPRAAPLALRPASEKPGPFACCSRRNRERGCAAVRRTRGYGGSPTRWACEPGRARRAWSDRATSALWGISIRLVSAGRSSGSPSTSVCLMSPGWASTSRSFIGVLPTSVRALLFGRALARSRTSQTREPNRTRRRPEVCHGSAQLGAPEVQSEQVKCGLVSSRPHASAEFVWPSWATRATIPATGPQPREPLPHTASSQRLRQWLLGGTDERRAQRRQPRRGPDSTQATRGVAADGPRWPHRHGHRGPDRYAGPPHGQACPGRGVPQGRCGSRHSFLHVPAGYGHGDEHARRLQIDELGNGLRRLDRPPGLGDDSRSALARGDGDRACLLYTSPSP